MDFRGALLRGWRLLVVLGIIGAIAGYLSLPSAPAVAPGSPGSTPTIYAATAILGPSGKRNSLSLGQIYLDVRNPNVLADAAAAANVGVSPGQLGAVVGVENGRTALGIGKKIRSIRVKAMGITVEGDDATSPTILCNAVAQAVQTFIGQQAQSQYAVDVKSIAAKVQTLENEILSVDAQINGDIPATGTGALLTTQKRVLQQQLTVAVTTQLGLTLNGAKIPGYSILRPATFATPASFGGKLTVASVVNHRSTRLLGGLVVGLLVAAGIILLVEALDRSLRLVRAVEEAFDLPVVAEIPAGGPRRPSLQRASVESRLEVVVAPGSPIAEAYRRLHTALLLEPLAAEMALFGNGNGNGYGYGNGNGNGYGNGQGPGYGNGTHTTEGLANHADAANGRDVAYEGNGRKSRRQVILVVSPGSENTRSVLVANVAAVCAEAGAQALVVSMGDLRWARSSGPAAPAFENHGEIDPQDLVPLSTASSVEGVAMLQFDQVLSSRGQVVTQGPPIIKAARQVADYVLIDAPSLLRSHDAMALLPAVDVVLLVAQYAVTRTDEAREAGDMLRRFRAPVLGVAFTNIPTRIRGSRERDPGPGPDTSNVVLEGYTAAPEAQPASTGGLWL